MSATLVLHVPLRYGKSHALQQLHLLTLYPIKVNSNGKPLIDGGIGANNPSNEAWTSIRQLHSDHQDAVAALVSIGTGNSLPKRRARANLSSENGKGLPHDEAYGHRNPIKHINKCRRI